MTIDCLFDNIDIFLLFMKKPTVISQIGKLMTLAGILLIPLLFIFVYERTYLAIVESSYTQKLEEMTKEMISSR
jgi:hypothetical protein